LKHRNEQTDELMTNIRLPAADSLSGRQTTIASKEGLRTREASGARHLLTARGLR